ncbi:hypothetical protein [Nocardia sp. NBC_01377]|uniref:hypothetical protein n=1 Tax=Nocardia sp. NBC_01377 TaxID=2903595 RepID=UPI00386A6463
MQFGLNDAWGTEHSTTLWTSLLPCVFNLEQGCGPNAAAEGRVTDYRGVSGGEYAARIRAVVTYVRYYAPDAEVVLVGYPELFPAGQDFACVNILGASNFIQPRAEGLIEYLDRVDTAQREAARILGIELFDTRAVTTGHGLCSNDPWLNGAFDPRADPVGIPFHPSVPALKPVVPDPGHPLQLVHHDDVAVAITLAAVASAPPGAYNIAGDGVVTISQIVSALGGRPVRVPAAAATMVSRAIAQLPFVPPVLEWLHLARTSVVMDTTKAKRRLGWHPFRTSRQTLDALAASHTAPHKPTRAEEFD